MQRKSLFALSIALVAAAAIFGPVLLPALSGDAETAHAQQAVPAHQPTPHAPSDREALVKRGEYLAKAGDCIACHTPRGGQPYQGGYALPTPFGTMYAPNLTPHKEYGIGDWTADDFYRALHEGIRKDGAYLYPAFPYTYYSKITRADSDAIFAYLQSLPPVANKVQENEMPFPFNQRIILLGWRILFFRKGEFEPDPKQSAEWNRGAYLVDGLGHCAMCHTQLTPLGAPLPLFSKTFSGGMIPVQNWYAPAINDDPKYGLGNWSEQDVVDLLRHGVSPRGAVFGPMADVVHNSTQYMSEADTRAMAKYLKSYKSKGVSSPPLQYEVGEEFGQELFKEGQAVYAANCAVCHGADGKGQPPHFPPLADNGSIMMHSSVNAIKMVLNGGYPPVTPGNPKPYGMPPFAQSLSDREVAAVASYIRMAWGNGGEAVSPQQVNDMRSAPLD